MSRGLNLVGASIQDIEIALSAGALTNVELIAQYLRRIATYDCRCLALKPAPIFNHNVFIEAAASDHHRISGQPTRALRHFGMPSVTVPMGLIGSKSVPMGLTFVGRAYDDVKLLQRANTFEKHTQHRTKPRHTPPLESDFFNLENPVSKRPRPPTLCIERCDVTPSSSGCLRVTIEGYLGVALDERSGADPALTITINGQDVPKEQAMIR